MTKGLQETLKIRIIKYEMTPFYFLFLMVEIVALYHFAIESYFRNVHFSLISKCELIIIK